VAADLLKPAPTEIHIAGNAFDWSFGVQLEREPCDVDQTFLFQLLDSDRVDVAPGSNVIREDDQLDGLGWFDHVLPLQPPHWRCDSRPTQHLVERWHNGGEAELALVRAWRGNHWGFRRQ
jgi:hypothetical protein